MEKRIVEIRFSERGQWEARTKSPREEDSAAAFRTRISASKCDEL